jgi:homoserine dehydrogenase
MKTYTALLTGLGNVGLNFLRLLRDKEAILREQYGLHLDVVGVADTSGILTDPNGLDLAQIIHHKEQKRGVGALGQRGIPPQQMVQNVQADFLLEATPNDLKTGQPGLDLARTALRTGKHAVLASKSSLVLGYAELAGLAGPTAQLRFSGAVCGALPTVNVGRRDLAAAKIRRVEAVLNGTTQLILTLMAQGQSFEDALEEAQRIGIAEPDPSLDVDGWDTTLKLVIIANAVLNLPLKLEDVAVKGIFPLETHGERWALLGVLDLTEDGAYRASVEPTPLKPDHPFYHLGRDEMGIIYSTDIYGRITATCAGSGPTGASAGMLRDVIDIHSMLRG